MRVLHDETRLEDSVRGGTLQVEKNQQKSIKKLKGGKKIHFAKSLLRQFGTGKLLMIIGRRLCSQ